MLRAISSGVVLLLLAGCASTSQVPAQASLDHTRHTEEEARAKHYLSVLWAKKNRFEQSHPELFDADANGTSAAGAERIVTADECQKVEASRWADSVRYGQDFAGYQNFVSAMERCLGSEGNEMG